MYFVTTNQPGYVLFSMTPHGRAAIGLTEQGIVRLLSPGAEPKQWQVLREWSQKVHSHTDLMVHLGNVDEPESAEAILRHLPAETLS